MTVLHFSAESSFDMQGMWRVSWLNAAGAADSLLLFSRLSRIAPWIERVIRAARCAGQNANASAR
jgi:hypothetical protein